MKIAFVSSRIGGGVNSWMLDFGVEMARRGDEIVFFGRDSGFIDEARRRGAKALRIDFGANFNPFAISRFYRFFEQFGIELACLNVRKELRCAGIASRMHGIPVVQRISRPGDISHRLDQRITQRYLVDEILVDNPWIQAELPRRFDIIPRDKVHCIYNGKALLTVPKTSRNPSPRFVIAAPLTHDQGHGNLIQAFYRLRQKGYDDFSCDIFGDGVRRDELSRRIRERGLQNHLRLRRVCRDMSARLPGYDYAILASREEATTDTVLEYFSAALPCLLSDGAIAGIGIPGLFTSNHGYRFPFKSVDQITACLQSCMEAPTERFLEQSLAVHDLATRYFNLDARVTEVRRYFGRIVEADMSPSGAHRAA